MWQRCRPVHPPCPERAMAACSRALHRLPGPALLWMATITALFSTALGKCGPPPTLPDAYPLTEQNHTEYETGTSVKYVCRPGYIRSNSNQFLTCQHSGVWRNMITCAKKRCRHPGEIRDGIMTVHTDLNFGSKISFSCLEGYILVGSDTSFCEVGDRGVEWSDPLPQCLIAKCAPPPAISNGRHSGREKAYTYGSSVTYSCDPQFSLIGAASISCSVENKTNSVWTPSPPVCKRVYCPYPDVEHGRLMAGFRSTYRYKDSVEFDCNYGFKLVGSRVSRCDADAAWNPPLPVCEQNSCIGKPTILHANWLRDQMNPEKLYPAGTTLTFRCYPGYQASGDSTVKCQNNLTWSSPALCKERCCPKPELKGGQITRHRRSKSDRDCEYFYRDSISYSCHERENLQSSCQEDGTWSPEATCDNYCYFPPNVAHGSYETIKPPTIVESNNVQYTCEPGYRLVGEKTLSCSKKGWSAPAPQCKAVCPRPEIKHGQLHVNKSQYLEPDTITVFCDSGYQLVGNETITCSEDKTWSPALPTCEWETPEGCESVTRGLKLMQCLPNPTDTKLALEMYKLSLEIQYLEIQLEKARRDLQSPEAPTPHSTEMDSGSLQSPYPEEEGPLQRPEF